MSLKDFFNKLFASKPADSQDEQSAPATSQEPQAMSEAPSQPEQAMPETPSQPVEPAEPTVSSEEPATEDVAPQSDSNNPESNV